MPQDYPLIQGQMVSWAEIGIALEIAGGESFKTSDFTELSWKHAMEGAENQYGTGPMPVGDVVGRYKPEASMTMYMAKAIEFRRKLALVNKKLTVVRFTIPIAWSPLDGNGEVFRVELKGCRLISEEIDNAPGGGAATLAMPLLVGRIELDGKSLV
jgi:hypothetical protein